MPCIVIMFGTIFSIKGMAFTLKERQILGIHGLLPPVVFSQKEQMDRVVANFRHWDNDLDRYIYLAALLDRNEKLFYQVVSANIDEMAPIIYTPTVGQACQKYGFIFRKPRLVPVLNLVILSCGRQRSASFAES